MTKARGKQSGPRGNGIRRTAKTIDMFTKWTGWDATTVKEHGHILISININGEGAAPGHKTQYIEQTFTLRDEYSKKIISIKTRLSKPVNGTIPAERMPDVFKAIKNRIVNPNLRVKYMTTRNAFGDTCLWKLYKGEMILIAVNGVSYHKLDGKALEIAADEMYFDGCDVKLGKRTTGFVCGIGEDGKKIKIKSGKRKRLPNK